MSILAELAEEQTWSNFKNEAAAYRREQKQSGRYVDALHRVWNIMYDLQTGGQAAMKKAKIADLLDDAQPLDEEDPEVQEELFPVLQSMGTTPEQMTGTSEKVRDAYRKWLKAN